MFSQKKKTKKKTGFGLLFHVQSIPLTVEHYGQLMEKRETGSLQMKVGMLRFHVKK